VKSHPRERVSAWRGGRVQAKIVCYDVPPRRGRLFVPLFSHEISNRKVCSRAKWQ